MGYARYFLAIGEAKKAEQILTKLYKIVKAGNRTERLIVVEVTYAIYNKLIGEVDKATKNLLAAMELAASENLIMFFINGNEQIYDLLLEIIKKHSLKNSKIPKTFLDNIKVVIEREKNIKKTIQQQG